MPGSIIGSTSLALSLALSPSVKGPPPLDTSGLCEDRLSDKASGGARSGSAASQGAIAAKAIPMKGLNKYGRILVFGARKRVLLKVVA